MATTEYHDSMMTVELEHANQDGKEPLMVSSNLNALLKAVAQMHKKLPVASYECQAGADGYDYVIILKDGREWRQVIWLDGTDDPRMTFIVNDQWRLSEFMLHRVIRDLIVRMNVEAGLTKLSVVYS